MLKIGSNSINNSIAFTSIGNAKNQTRNNKTFSDYAFMASCLSGFCAASIGAVLLIKNNKVNLSDLDFHNGIAKLKNGTNFTGIVNTKLNNGDKISLSYSNGLIQRSQRQGEKNFIKIFSTNKKGERIVETITKDNKVKVNVDDVLKRVQDANTIASSVMFVGGLIDAATDKNETPPLVLTKKYDDDAMARIITCSANRELVLDEILTDCSSESKEFAEKILNSEYIISRFDFKELNQILKLISKGDTDILNALQNIINENNSGDVLKIKLRLNKIQQTQDISLGQSKFNLPRIPKYDMPVGNFSLHLDED